MSAASGGNAGGAPPAGGAPFVGRVRTRPVELRLGADDAERWTIRVQMAEVWDTIRVLVPPTEPVLALKVAALEALFPQAAYHDDFVLKLNGIEVLDENAPVAEVGAVNGSIFLIQHRRRRPVR